MKRESALVIEGGGTRNVFTAGVLEAFLENEYNPFKYFIAVSGGAYTVASYLSKQHKRNYGIFTNIMTTDFFSFKRFLSGGHYMDLDWLWTNVIENYPFDFKNMEKNLKGKKFIGVITKETCAGKNFIEAAYESIDTDNLPAVFKSGASIPFFYKAKKNKNNELLLDGGIMDPLPVRKAYHQGYRKIVVIRTYPGNTIPGSGLYKIILKLAGKRKLLHYLSLSQQKYKDAFDFIDNPPSDVIIDIISPGAALESVTNTSCRKKIIKDYYTGKEIGDKYIAKIKENK